MHCTYVKLPGGMSAIVCTSGRSRVKHCTACDQVAPYLCDWKIGGGKTCDLPICAVHAEEVATDKHLCPKHSRAYQQWLTQRAQRGLSLPGGAQPAQNGAESAQGEKS
jgi:hypothetical protein